MEPSRILFTLRFALDLARVRQRQRRQAKVRTILFREERMIARLEWCLAQLERQARAGRRQQTATD